MAKCESCNAELVEGGKLENKLDIKKTTFTGYGILKQRTTILSILVDNDSVGIVQEGQEASLILQETPFYDCAFGESAILFNIVSHN